MKVPDFSLIDIGIEYVKKTFPGLNLGEPTEKTEWSAKWIVDGIKYVLEQNPKTASGFIFGYFGGKFPNGFELRRFYV